MTLPALRIPPHSLEAEMAVIGSLIIKNDLIDDIDLKYSDFYKFEHQIIFKSVHDLISSGKDADVISVFDELSRANQIDDVGGFVALNEITACVAANSSVKAYVAIVKDHAKLRQAIEVADTIQSEAYNPNGKRSDQVIINAQRAVTELLGSSVDAKARSASVGIKDHLELLEKRASGEIKRTPTGLKNLDRMLNGGLPDEGVYWVIGGRQSMGKTAFALDICTKIASSGIPVGFISGEMLESEIMDRLIASVGRVDLDDVVNPEDVKDADNFWSRTTEAARKIESMPLYIDDDEVVTRSKVLSKIRYMARAYGCKVVAIDYVQLIDTEDDSRDLFAYKLGRLSKAIKALRKELKVSILLLAQLKVPKDEETIPVMGAVGDSKQIEDDGEVVSFIHRPIRANTELGTEFENYALLNICKNRQGRTGYVDLNFDGRYQVFTDWFGQRPEKGRKL